MNNSELNNLKDSVPEIISWSTLFIQQLFVECARHGDIRINKLQGAYYEDGETNT